MSGLAEADQKELQTFLDAEQAKARVQSSIHTFTDRCWDQCIKSSIGSSFGRGEEACLSNCVERFLDTSLFIVNKLQEQRGQMSSVTDRFGSSNSSSSSCNLVLQQSFGYQEVQQPPQETSVSGRRGSSINFKNQQPNELRCRGVEFCCLTYTLIKSGSYLIPLEFAFVSGCIIVLTTTTPTVVAAVDTLPRISPLVLLFLAITTLAWQVIGLATIRIETSSIYRLYIHINFLLVLITAIVGSIGTVVIATKHRQSVEVCTRVYGNPPLNSSNGVPIDELDKFAPGRKICDYFMWAQTAAMGGLVLVLSVTQVYFSYFQRAYGQKQRAALQQLESYDKET
ncbi:hypothetical protein NDA18_001733 [Ustilago nuda]|nr:hypothetical protein NDA18_001733 [Ustilago nuda]